MSKGIIAIMAACCWAAPSIAAQADQFDLNCTGTATSYQNGSKLSGPFSRVLHVDLSRGEYCIDSCSSVAKIQDVDSLQITLVDTARRRGSFSHFKDTAKVDRTTGAYTVAYMDSNKLEFLTAEAICEPARFTPFPQTKF